MRRLLVPLMLMVFVAGCGQESSEPSTTDAPSEAEQQETNPPSATDPAQSEAAVRDALLAWMQAGNEGDCDTVKTRVTQPDSVDCDAVKEQQGLWRDFLSLDETAFHVELFDESAFVEVADPSGESNVWDLVWINGDWLIVVDAEDA